MVYIITNVSSYGVLVKLCTNVYLKGIKFIFQAFHIRRHLIASTLIAPKLSFRKSPLQRVLNTRTLFSCV